MAESIFTVLATRKTSTTVPFMGKSEDGKTISVPHEIPDELFPTDEEFESPEMLIEWANQADCMFEMLQKGVGKALIEVRAKFKAPKKGKDKAKDTWDAEYGQAQVDSMTWTSVKRPNQPKNDQAAIAAAGLQATIDTMQSMIAVGLGKTKIKEVLDEKYSGDDAIIAAIVTQLKF